MKIGGVPHAGIRVKFVTAAVIAPYKTQVGDAVPQKRTLVALK
jgi:hypothetical protein